MSEIVIAGVFTVIGATLGFLGTLIQSKVAAKNNIEAVKAQSEKEIGRHRYLEKEKLYSDIISLLPQFMFSANVKTGKITFDEKATVQINSFKARLSIFSTEEIYTEFYKLADFFCSERSEEKKVENLNKFSKILMDDLKNV